MSYFDIDPGYISDAEARYLDWWHEHYRDVRDNPDERY